MARDIDVSDVQNQAAGCSVTGVAALLPTHVSVQARGASVAANTSATGQAIKCSAVVGTGMNADVTAGVAVEAI